MKCPSCNSTIPPDSDICPACFSQVQPTQEPLTPPRPTAPRANPREVEKQPEALRKTREGRRQAPPRENATRSNVEGHFSARVSKKPLILVAGILAAIILVAIGYVVLDNRQAPVPPVAKETPAPAPEAPAPEKPAAEQPAPAEAKPAPAPPVPDKKAVAKKASSSRTKRPAVKEAQPAPKQTWTYNPVPAQPAPKPAPAPKQKAGIAGWLDKTLGPEVPVTPPVQAGDAKNGM